MQPHIEKLVKLQSVDLERTRVNNALRALPAELAQAQAELDAAERKAAEASDALTREETLRTRLERDIAGFREKLARFRKQLDAVKTPEQAAAIEHEIQFAQDEAERLNRFFGNLLDMTRLEAGGVRATDDAVDIAEIAESVGIRVHDLARDHRLVVDIETNLPLAQGDVGLLEQVLFNLLDNAFKYAMPGTLVQLRARRDDRFVVMEVIDEGPGIPASQVETIFNKFTRLEQGDRKRAGTGLGLAIARGFVTAMGGTLQASGRNDRPGAVFTLRLPVATIEQQLGANEVAEHG